MKFNDTQYYYQGYSSHQAGLPYESSPHPIGSPNRLEWCRGWRDAENDSRKRLTPTENDNANQQFESLPAKQVAIWNGEGLPPVGCECELVNFFGNDFPDFVGEPDEVVKIIGNGFTNGCPVAFYEADGGRGGVLAYAVEQCFRPIRAEADRKRDKAKNAIAELCRSSASNGHSADMIYDAIAAGKIPHIKLESADE